MRTWDRTLVEFFRYFLRVRAIKFVQIANTVGIVEFVGFVKSVWLVEKVSAER